MAEYRAPVGTDWVLVTIRVELPTSVPRAEAFDAAERHILALATKVRIKFDRDYSAVPIRPPRTELERFRKSGKLFVVPRMDRSADIAVENSRNPPHHHAPGGTVRPSDRRSAGRRLRVTVAGPPGRRYGRTSSGISASPRSGPLATPDVGLSSASWTAASPPTGALRNSERGPLFLSRPRWARLSAAGPC
jgi:hypothetical protein